MESDPGEKVALRVGLEFGWGDVTDVPFVDVAGRDVPGGDQVPEPLRGDRIDFVVVGGQSPAPSPPPTGCARQSRALSRQWSAKAIAA